METSYTSIRVKTPLLKTYLIQIFVDIDQKFNINKYKITINVFR